MAHTHASSHGQPLPSPPEDPAIDGGTDRSALRIGDLAALAGVTADTVRYYERRGLLPPARRRTSGYREFPAEAARLVRFIKHAQALGFSLTEVEELIRLRASRAPSHGLEARQVAVSKILDIDERVRRLGALRTALAGLVTQCDETCGTDNGAVGLMDCPLLAALDEPAPASQTDAIRQSPPR